MSLDFFFFLFLRGKKKHCNHKESGTHTSLQVAKKLMSIKMTAQPFPLSNFVVVDTLKQRSLQLN